MDIQEQVNEQGQKKHNYEVTIWANVFDWQVSPRENHETGHTFYDIKLASNTFLEMPDGQKKDVGHYHFTTNIMPKMTFGEPGSPRAMRGIPFPQDWDGVTLLRVENVAKEGQPIFEVTDRIEGVSPKALSEAIAERNAAWRSAHREERKELTSGRGDQEPVSKRLQDPSL